MEQVNLETQKREATTKGQLKKSRIDGLVPAIVYGSEEKSMPIFVKEKEISKIIKLGVNTLINLNLDGSSKTVLIKEVQKHVVSEKLLHVDFHAISMQSKIEVEVAVHIVGECPGVKTQGGVLEHILREIKVRCLPTNIPKSIDVDVSSLNIGRNISIKDITPPANVEILTVKESIIVNVVAPTKIEEAVAAVDAVAAAAEPEVIAKGKKEEEGAEGAEPAAGDKTAAGKTPAAKTDAKPAAGKPEKK